MLSRAIRIAIAVVVIILLLYAVWQVSAWWQGRKQSSRLKMGEVRRHSPQLVEVSPTVVDKIDYQALVNREAAEEIADLHQEIEWYAEYSAELERRLVEGEGQVTPPMAGDEGYTVNWSEEWSDGETWTDGASATYSIDYHLPPIDLQVYKTDEGVWLGTSSIGVTIGEVEVVEPRQKAGGFWSKLGFGLYAGAGSHSGKLNPIVGLGLSYSGWGVQFQAGEDYRGVLVGKEW